MFDFTVHSQIQRMEATVFLLSEKRQRCGSPIKIHNMFGNSIFHVCLVLLGMQQGLLCGRTQRYLDKVVQSNPGRLVKLLIMLISSACIVSPSLRISM